MAWLMVSVWELGRIDNGDGWRVLRRATVFGSDKWTMQVLRTQYDMAPLEMGAIVQSLPTSTPGLVVFMLAIVQRGLGFAQFHVWPMTACYLALYLFGAGCWVRAAGTMGSRTAMALLFGVLLLNPFTSSYFNSFYEEVAVLALMPWWTFETHRALQARHRQGLRGFYLSTAAMVLTKPQMLPVLIVVLALYLKRPRPALWASGLIVMLAALTTAKGTLQHAPYNAFNRIQNGLAYAMSDVSHWQARHHEARMTEAGQHVRWDSAQALGLPDSIKPAWGHSFWPDGDHLAPPARQAAIDAGKAHAFVATLARHPQALWQVVTQSYVTAAKADYTQAYLYMQGGRCDPTPAPTLWQRVMAHLGWFFWLAPPAFALACWLRNRAAAALMAIVLVSPCFVVLGDGYYEFEKHLMPYLWIGLGGVASLVAQRLPKRATTAV
jgi:hypothetical protein